METSFQNIKDLPVTDRPREKMTTLGPGALSDIELLAILISSGTKTLPLFQVCQNLLDKVNNNLSGLKELSVENIATVKGIGNVRAISLIAAVEFGNRCARLSMPLNLKDDEAVQRYIAAFYKGVKQLQYQS